MCFQCTYTCIWTFHSDKEVKNLPATQKPQEMWAWSLGQEDPLKEDMATHSSILAWRISWTEDHEELESIGSQRVGHDWSDLRHTQTCFYTCSCSYIHLHIHIYFWIFKFYFSLRVINHAKTTFYVVCCEWELNTDLEFLCYLIYSH